MSLFLCAEQTPSLQTPFLWNSHVYRRIAMFGKKGPFNQNITISMFEATSETDYSNTQSTSSSSASTTVD